MFPFTGFDVGSRTKSNFPLDIVAGFGCTAGVSFSQPGVILVPIGGCRSSPLFD